MKPNILFLYDYFYPGYRAGGPIQSLTNLALALQTEYTISVVTSVRDLDSTEPYKDIISNSWSQVILPGSKIHIQVFYAHSSLDASMYQQIFREINPSVVYFNNIYSGHFFRLPLQVMKRLNVRPKLVICPRGMLQKGALAVKPVKKQFYLYYLRYSRKLKKAYWHATNQEEFDDIKKHFPISKGIVIASNIPKVPYSTISFPKKTAGGLKLVYLSLIAEKKNLLLLLQVMMSTNTVTLDVYGPVTDTIYWQKCEVLIRQMPDKVEYKGDVQPINVQEILSQYDALILLTKGENFGHALYESLSVGRPVITSQFTPWHELEQKHAGWNVGIENNEDCSALLTRLTVANRDEWEKYCMGAHRLAKEYFNNLDTLVSYNKLFSI